MSMPVIERPDNPLDRDQAINNLIESVALVETGLSHIINAEGEKIQKVVDPDADYTIAEITDVNNSVGKMINTVSKLEMFLQNKLDIVKELDTEGGGGITISTDGLSATHLTNGTTNVTPTGTPIVLETVTYSNGFTANATNDTFTVVNDGAYLISYEFIAREPAVSTYQMGLKIDGVINPNTIVERIEDNDVDHIMYNSAILDLMAGAELQVVLIGPDRQIFFNDDVGASLTITKVETGLSVAHLTGGTIISTPEGTPMVLEAANYSNGFTANATNDTFTVTTAGSYLMTYGFTQGDLLVYEYKMALKINGVINPSTIINHLLYGIFDRQLYNFLVLNLTAGSTVQLVLIGEDVELPINAEVGASLTAARIA